MFSKTCAFLLPAIIAVTGIAVLDAQIAKPIPLPTKEEYAKVTTLVESNNVVDVDEAGPKIRYFLNGQRVPPELCFKWLPALEVRERHEEVAEFALTGLLMRPERKFFDRLPVFRINALISISRFDEALQTAKVFYNVCSLARSSEAVDNFAKCVQLARHDDGDIGLKFRLDQIEADNDSEALNSAEIGKMDEGSEILRSVRVDPNLYSAALTFWQKKAQSGKYSDILSYGNMLLIADKPNDALSVFRSLEKIAIDAENLTEATDGIARSLRAIDGNVYRANHFIALLNKKYTTPNNQGDSPEMFNAP